MSSTNTFAIPKHKRELVLPNTRALRWEYLMWSIVCFFILFWHFSHYVTISIVRIFLRQEKSELWWYSLQTSPYGSLLSLLLYFFFCFFEIVRVHPSPWPHVCLFLNTTVTVAKRYDFLNNLGGILSLPLLFLSQTFSACLCCLLLTISSLLACTHTHILSTTSSPKVLPKLSVKREWEEMGCREDGALITPSLPLLLLLPFEHFSVLYCYLWNSWMLCALLLSIKTAYLQMLCLLASVWLHSVRFGSVVLYLLCLLMLIFL